MRVHNVKSWPHQFGAIIEGRKTAELRKNDRGYQVGDRLLLREWDPFRNLYTGRSAKAEITHKLDKDNVCAVSREALLPEYAILSIKLVFSRGCATPECPNDPGGNIWDDYTYCDECHERINGRL